MVVLNFKGITTMTILSLIIIELILIKTDLDNITTLGITFLTSLILFNVFANIKIKKSSVNTAKYQRLNSHK